MLIWNMRLIDLFSSCPKDWNLQSYLLTHLYVVCMTQLLELTPKIVFTTLTYKQDGPIYLTL